MIRTQGGMSSTDEDYIEYDEGQFYAHQLFEGFGLTVRTVVAGHTLEELQKDLDGLLSMWKGITEQAKSAALAADEGVESAMPVMLHGAMGQTHSVVQDLFNDKVKRMVVDSPVTCHEVTSYLQEIAPDLCNRVELYSKKNPL